MRYKLLILVLVFLSGCVSYPEKFSNEQIKTCALDIDSQACWKMANTIQSTLVNKFTYIDQGEEDILKTHINTVKNNENFIGDCDDFAITAADMALDLNVPKSLIQTQLVLYKTKLHLIALIGNYAIDNNYIYAKHINSLSYTPIANIFDFIK